MGLEIGLILILHIYIYIFFSFLKKNLWLRFHPSTKRVHNNWLFFFTLSSCFTHTHYFMHFLSHFNSPSIYFIHQKIARSIEDYQCFKCLLSRTSVDSKILLWKLYVRLLWRFAVFVLLCQNYYSFSSIF